MAFRLDRNRLRSVLDLLVTLLLGVASIALIWKLLWPGVRPAQSGPSRPTSTMAASDDIAKQGLTTSLGRRVLKKADRARVVLIEFSDFQCPFCKRHFTEVFDQLESQFVNTGKIQYAFRHYPLERVHTEAMRAAQAAECAASQGKFWSMRRALFQGPTLQSAWSEQSGVTGLDLPSLERCMTGEMDKNILDDLAEGKRLGVRSTPMFFIGVERADSTVHLVTRINGARPFEVFESALISAFELN